MRRNAEHISDKNCVETFEFMPERPHSCPPTFAIQTQRHPSFHVTSMVKVLSYADLERPLPSQTFHPRLIKFLLLIRDKMPYLTMCQSLFSLL
ncbi:hypothetical protein PsorP6_001410 [Peronosclerospora sorghi]|uniref:Uncharacterized protein n=1 Tax=Peronosclerospora sorghi TaxID=230839 RepID=A0ACC0WUS1_9STRA|nr:hypothetical protein PsorP6_001410 [Peronosclerospora sorghi]